MKERILSGLQPSGRLHVGNYLGALKNFVELQNSGEYDCFFFIADYHSISEPPYESEQKRKDILDLMKSYLAAGLDPKKSTLFVQSQIPAHTELSWIFNSVTPMGELSRMTQFKDKSEDGEANAALFTYPVLQAADILIYKPAFVPTGEDQDQHIELSRVIARKFNSRYGEVFPEPQSKHTDIPRVISLNDPSKKMSKSKPNGCLFIDDGPEEIAKKLSSAVTDSGSEIKYDAVHKPGISNLLRLASALSSKEIAVLEQEFAGKNYGEFKSYAAKTVADYFAAYRERKTKLSDAKAEKIFTKGSMKAAKIADATLLEVKDRIGLI
ncbi:MAG: tryptophan--tRNA ligase [bacterium]|nr:tryptophan--tRNA ligase [bacterium]